MMKSISWCSSSQRCSGDWTAAVLLMENDDGLLQEVQRLSLCVSLHQTGCFHEGISVTQRLTGFSFLR